MEPRIPKKTAKKMVVVAGIFDAVDLGIDALSLGTVGAIISPFLTVLAYGTMGIWFMKRGVSLRNFKNFFWFNGSFAFELIPYVGDLPALTVATIRMIAITNAQDAGIPIEALSGGTSPAAARGVTTANRPSVPPPMSAARTTVQTSTSPNVLTLASPPSGQGNMPKRS